MLTDSSSKDVVTVQREIVRRYADQLRQAASGAGGALGGGALGGGALGGGRPRLSNEGTLRCYALLNECAMELAGLNRPRSYETAEQQSRN